MSKRKAAEKLTKEEHPKRQKKPDKEEKDDGLSYVGGEECDCFEHGSCVVRLFDDVMWLKRLVRLERSRMKLQALYANAFERECPETFNNVVPITLKPTAALLQQVKAALDKEDPRKRVNPDLEVRPLPDDYQNKSMRGQKGVFAKKDIPGGTFLCEYYGECIEIKESEKREATNDYIFEVEHAPPLALVKRLKDKAPTLVYAIDPMNGNGNGVAEYINDWHTDAGASSDDELFDRMNALVFGVRYKGMVTIVIASFTDIKQGQEVLIDYGDKFWEK